MWFSCVMQHQAFCGNSLSKVPAYHFRVHLVIRLCKKLPSASILNIINCRHTLWSQIPCTEHLKLLHNRRSDRNHVHHIFVVTQFARFSNSFDQAHTTAEIDPASQEMPQSKMFSKYQSSFFTCLCNSSLWYNILNISDYKWEVLESPHAHKMVLVNFLGTWSFAMLRRVDWRCLFFPLAGYWSSI